MRNPDELPEPRQLSSWKARADVLVNHIIQKPSGNHVMSILEAGCGTKWGLDLKGVRYTLTGVDIDENALSTREIQQGDMDTVILGDLRSVDLPENEYDVIYNAYVLEHIDGAECVLKNFVRWLKPGGILILLIPDRDSARGFLTRITPFWLHIFYKKYIQGMKDAGKPGHDPFPTFYDKIVSRSGIHNFCKQHGLEIKAEYGFKPKPKNRQIYYYFSNLLLLVVHFASFGSLSVKYGDLIYVIEKP